jgi:hypothetical protein
MSIIFLKFTLVTIEIPIWGQSIPKKKFLGVKFLFPKALQNPENRPHRLGGEL